MKIGFQPEDKDDYVLLLLFAKLVREADKEELSKVKALWLEMKKNEKLS